jgi:acetyl-CoA synthetase
MHAEDQKVLTYIEVLEEVCRLANWLKSQGVGAGDAVAIYLPMLPELPIAMLACARIGAVHSVVFGGFSSEALAVRVLDCKPKVLIVASGVMRGTKKIELKKIADEACNICKSKGFRVR